jgi:hypothetical protein
VLGVILVGCVYCSVYHADKNDVVELGLGPMRMFAEKGELAVVEYPISKNCQALFCDTKCKLLFRAWLLNQFDPWKTGCHPSWSSFLRYCNVLKKTRVLKYW